MASINTSVNAAPSSASSSLTKNPATVPLLNSPTTPPPVLNSAIDRQIKSKSSVFFLFFLMNFFFLNIHNSL